jgi:hypothetical protein
VVAHAPRSPSASTSWKTQRVSRSHPATRPEAGSTRSRMPPAGAGPPCLEIGRQGGTDGPPSSGGRRGASRPAPSTKTDDERGPPSGFDAASSDGALVTRAAQSWRNTWQEARVVTAGKPAAFPQRTASPADSSPDGRPAMSEEARQWGSASASSCSSLVQS